MRRNLSMEYPIFEIGPKLYVHGEDAVNMAVFADSLAERYDVRIIFSAQYVDIPAISKATKNIYVFSQHVDGVYPGRGIGAVLPEAVKNAGASGTILNHAEKKMTLNELSRAISRCKEVGLTSLVCADSLAECIAVTYLGADIILKESEDMIGGEKSCAHRKISSDENEIRKHRKDIVVLHGAGIKNEKDIYDIILSGATATGSTSAIFKSEKPLDAMERCVAAVRQAWDDRQAQLRANKMPQYPYGYKTLNKSWR